MNRTVRAFSTTSRRALFRNRRLIAQHDGAVEVQHVRFARPAMRRSRLHSAAMWSIGTTATLWYFGYFDDDEVEEEETQSTTRQVKLAVEQVQSVTEQEKVAADGSDPTKVVATDGLTVDENGEVILPEEPPEDAWIIPLGWAKECPPTYYKGSDPEWQAFVKFAKDREKTKACKAELAGLAKQYIANLRQLQKFLGQPMQGGKYWLDIDFPVGPPPEYERTVLEISTDYIALTTRPVKEANVKRLNRALFPTATAFSFLATWKTLWQFQVNRVRSFLNLEPVAGSEKPRLPPGYRNLDNFTKKGAAEPSNLDGMQGVKPPTSTDSPETKDSTMPPLSERAWLLKPLPSVPEPGEELSTATQEFKKTLVKNWKPASLGLPRGSLGVSGFVEVVGPKGMCVLDVSAAYDPTTKVWDGITLKIRRMQPRAQMPLGGR